MFWTYTQYIYCAAKLSYKSWETCESHVESSGHLCNSLADSIAHHISTTEILSLQTSGDELLQLNPHDIKDVVCECISVHCMLSQWPTYCLSRRSSCHGATSMFSEGAAQVCQLVKLYLAALLSSKSSFGVTRFECMLGHIILGKQVFRRCHGLELKSIAAWIFEEHCPLFTRLTCIVISHGKPIYNRHVYGRYVWDLHAHQG